MLDSFYGAFSPACFGLLGLWMVVVQIRGDLMRNGPYRRVSYSIALCFALPGIMSVLALVDDQNPLYWQISFIIVALGGAIMIYAVHRKGAELEPHHTVTNLLAIGLYLAIGLLAFIALLEKSAGPELLRVDAILLTAVIFLGFNAAWLMLYSPPAPAVPAADESETEPSRT